MNPARLPKILIVDDEPKIRELIGELVSESFYPILAANGEEAIEMALANRPDVILLDIMMPGISGIDVCERLRKRVATKDIPIIMLSAASQRDNRILSFNLGADDFIPKPFDADELVARIRAKLKHSPVRKENETIRCGNMVVDVGNALVKIDGNPVKVSGSEFEILKLLAENADRLVDRSQFVKRIWKGEAGTDRLMDAHLVALRRRIKKFSGTLDTVYGKGYVLRLPKKSSSSK